MTSHSSITAFEMAIIITAHTAGFLVAYRNTEPFISKLGIKWSLQLGFLILIAASYAFWATTYIQNDSQFSTIAFISRFATGFGSGLLNAVCLIVRVSGHQYSDTTPDNHFKWHMQGEGFGYMMGPLLLVRLNRTEDEHLFFFYLAGVTSIIWLLFTMCFQEDKHACNPSFYEQK